MNRKEPNPLPENMTRPSPPPPPPEPPKDFIEGLEFKCNRCGRCCGLTPFTRADYKRIRRKAEKLHVTFVKDSLKGHTVYFVKSIAGKVKKAGGFENVDPKDLVCPFLKIVGDGLTECVIWGERPELCRKFGNEAHLGMSLACPYQNINQKIEKGKS